MPVLTSVAAFLPILMLEGQVGFFLRPLPIVVTACLVISAWLWRQRWGFRSRSWAA